MTNLSELTQMKIYTEDRYLCPICNRNSNFIYVVKQVEDTYYLMEMCGKCEKHFEDIKIIPSRMVKDYPAPTK